ncbi:MAG: alpha/beta hydrolase [Phormidesmis sp.]
MVKLSRRSKRRLQAFFTAIAGAYLLFCLTLWHYQAKLIFFPDPTIRNTPANLGLLYEEVWLPTGKGTQKGILHGWWVPTINHNARTILYLHGNGSNIGDLIFRALQFHHWGYNILMIDYRGYGLSSGPFPSEQRVYEDAETAWRYLRTQKQIVGNNIIIYGRSLGGAIALNLATHHPNAAGAIIEASFTSMKAMVKHTYPHLPIPIDWILEHKFESIQKVRSLYLPLLFIHGTADAIIPPPMSQTLHNTAPKSSFKKLVWIQHGDHNNLPTVGGDRYRDAIRSFVESVTENDMLGS